MWFRKSRIRAVVEEFGSRAPEQSHKDSEEFPNEGGPSGNIARYDAVKPPLSLGVTAVGSLSLIVVGSPPPAPHSPAFPAPGPQHLPPALVARSPALSQASQPAGTHAPQPHRVVPHPAEDAPVDCSPW
ncbi:hypothetical protein Vafri_2292 [Volvox africanus]|nr:hypothetical protein Vafri_2292 [Volvox africanus]